jgi:hypothetical protein
MKKLSLVLLALLATLLIQHRAGGTTYIVFRYDDFTCDTPRLRETNVQRTQIWAAEQAVDGLFQKYGLRYVIAIIPESNGISLGEDPEKVSFIKRAVQAGRVEVAQHGFSHTNFARQNHRPGEFRDRNYESQLHDIAQGREILVRALDLTDIRTFVPPWNAWTSDTANIIKKLGFQILSADCYYYYKSAKGLTIVPFTTCLTGLEPMLAQGALPDDGIVVVLYHPFEIVRFQESLGSYYYGVERFEKLLQKLSAIPEVKVVTLKQLAKETKGLTVERYRAANNLWSMQSFWTKLLPAHLLPGTAQQPLYLGTEEYSQILRFWNSVTLFFVSSILAIGLLVRYFLGRLLSARWHFRVNVLAALLFCLSVIAELRLIQQGYHITGIRAIPGLLAGGFFLGLLWSVLWKTRQRDVSGQDYKIR